MKCRHAMVTDHRLLLLIFPLSQNERLLLTNSTLKLNLMKECNAIIHKKERVEEKYQMTKVRERVGEEWKKRVP